LNILTLPLDGNKAIGSEGVMIKTTQTLSRLG